MNVLIICASGGSVNERDSVIGLERVHYLLQRGQVIEVISPIELCSAPLEPFL